MCNQNPIKRTLGYDKKARSFKYPRCPCSVWSPRFKARPEVGFRVTVMVCSSKTNEDARVISKVKWMDSLWGNVFLNKHLKSNLQARRKSLDTGQNFETNCTMFMNWALFCACVAITVSGLRCHPVSYLPMCVASVMLNITFKTGFGFVSADIGWHFKTTTGQTNKEHQSVVQRSW